MRRHLAGIIGLALVFGGAYAYYTGRDHGSPAGPGMKVGAVLLAAWLAWPEVSRWNPWLTVLFLLGAAIGITQPKTILLLVPVLFIAWFFWPRDKLPRQQKT